MELTTRTTRTPSRIVATLVTVVMLCSTFARNAQKTFSPKDLTFRDGFGSRKGDRRIYVITGGGMDSRNPFWRPGSICKSLDCAASFSDHNASF